MASCFGAFLVLLATTTTTALCSADEIPPSSGTTVVWGLHPRRTSSAVVGGRGGGGGDDDDGGGLGESLPSWLSVAVSPYSARRRPHQPQRRPAPSSPSPAAARTYVLRPPSVVRASSASNDDGSHSSQVSQYGEDRDDARYTFAWSVKDDAGNNYGHRESRDGDVVDGSYRVLLPDGRLQTVTYRDEGNGLLAQVTYDDHNDVIAVARPFLTGSGELRRDRVLPRYRVPIDDRRLAPTTEEVARVLVLTGPSQDAEVTSGVSGTPGNNNDAPQADGQGRESDKMAVGADNNNQAELGNQVGAKLGDNIENANLANLGLKEEKDPPNANPEKTSSLAPAESKPEISDAGVNNEPTDIPPP